MQADHNHKTACVGRDFKDRLVPIALPWAVTPFARPGCLVAHPPWP